MASAARLLARSDFEWRNNRLRRYDRTVMAARVSCEIDLYA